MLAQFRTDRADHQRLGQIAPWKSRVGGRNGKNSMMPVRANKSSRRKHIETVTNKSSRFCILPMNERLVGAARWRVPIFKRLLKALVPARLHEKCSHNVTGSTGWERVGKRCTQIKCRIDPHVRLNGTD